MAKLSVAMIVRDEEETIERVLDSVKSFADEIIVVDTGSKDKTVALAKKKKVKIYHFDWVDDFSAARNFSFEKATNDWVMWIDADDVISEEDQLKIKNIKNNELDDPDAAAVFFNYQYQINDRNICTLQHERERIVRKSMGCYWVSPIHEVIKLPTDKKSYFRTDISLLHYPTEKKQKSKKNRNLDIIKKAMDKGYSKQDPRILYHYARELMARKCFKKAIKLFNQYLPSCNSLIERYEIILTLSQAYKMLEKPEEQRKVLTEAIGLIPSRAEAYVELGTIFYDKQEWQNATPLFYAAIKCEVPKNGITNLNYYHWLAYDFLSICLERQNRFEEAAEMMVKALPKNPQPERILKNIEFISTKMR